VNWKEWKVFDSVDEVVEGVGYCCPILVISIQFTILSFSIHHSQLSATTGILCSAVFSHCFLHYHSSPVLTTTNIPVVVIHGANNNEMDEWERARGEK
jgi:hypothetical protein